MAGNCSLHTNLNPADNFILKAGLTETVASKKINLILQQGASNFRNFRFKRQLLSEVPLF